MERFVFLWEANLQFPIDFDRLPWESAVPGSRFKVFRGDGQQLRVVEFTKDFVEPHWCEKGHLGLVLSGELEINFQGTLVRYPQGSGVFIPAGRPNAHKARAATPLVRLFLVEELTEPS